MTKPSTDNPIYEIRYAAPAPIAPYRLFGALSKWDPALHGADYRIAFHAPAIRVPSAALGAVVTALTGTHEIDGPVSIDITDVSPVVLGTDAYGVIHVPPNTPGRTDPDYIRQRTIRWFESRGFPAPGVETRGLSQPMTIAGGRARGRVVVISGLTPDSGAALVTHGIGGRQHFGFGWFSSPRA